MHTPDAHALFTNLRMHTPYAHALFTSTRFALYAMSGTDLVYDSRCPPSATPGSGIAEDGP
eukprot:2282785-Rhodomonas_salina.2